MKKRNFLSMAMTLCLTAAVTAQTVNVSPVPQRLVWGDKAFDQPKSIVIKGADEADADAVLIDLEPQTTLFVILGELAQLRVFFGISQ